MESAFISVNQHQLYLLSAKSQTGSAVATLLLPPFAEEMNKCRHLFRQLMVQLANSTASDVFLLDPYGTGDSAGDLTDTTALVWRQDYLSFIESLKTQGYQSINFVAVRFGVMQLLDLLTEPLPLPLNKLVLWQPQLAAGSFLQQFFRVKIAEQMALGEKLSQKQIESWLQQGETVEIAGYPLQQQLVDSILALKAAVNSSYQQTPLLWLETSNLPNISVVAQKNIDMLKQYFTVEYQQLNDAPYWSAQELVRADLLINSTVLFLESGHVA